MTRYPHYSSKPATFPEEEKGKGKISSFQRLRTKSPSCCIHSWKSKFCISLPGSHLTSHRAGCMQLAFIDPGVLKRAVLESPRVQTQAAPLFLFNDSFCLSALPFSEISNLQVSADMPASPREGEKWIEEGKHNSRNRAPISHMPSSMGCLPILGVSLSAYCTFQALERHNPEKPSTYFLLNSLENYGPESLNPFLSGGLGWTAP